MGHGGWGPGRADKRMEGMEHELTRANQGREIDSHVADRDGNYLSVK